MILFLQGTSHSGKSCFARSAARATGAGVLSLDLLKMGLIRSGSAGFSSLRPEDDAEIEERLWPIVQAIAETANENAQSLVIEGVYLPFASTAQLAQRLGSEQAQLFAIVFSEQYVRNHHQLIAQTAAAAERRVHQSVPSIAELAADHAFVHHQAQAFGWNIIDIASPSQWQRKICGLKGVPAKVLEALSPAQAAF